MRNAILFILKVLGGVARINKWHMVVVGMFGLFANATLSLTNSKKCIDKDMNCFLWVAKDPNACFTDENVVKYCHRACQECGNDTKLEIEENISLSTMMKTPVLNYTAYAWDNSDLTEIHQENGFISGSKNSSIVSMNVIMSNGFVTIEEGEERSYSIRFRLRRIGRINFSRDLPVRKKHT